MQAPDDARPPLAFQLLRHAKQCARPGVVVLSAAADAALVAAAGAPNDAGEDGLCGGPGAGADAAGADGTGGCAVRLERGALFSYDRALHALRHLAVRGDPREEPPPQQQHQHQQHQQQAFQNQHQQQQSEQRRRLAAVARRLDLTQAAMVGALGALVEVLRRDGVAAAAAGEVPAALGAFGGGSQGWAAGGGGGGSGEEEDGGEGSQFGRRGRRAHGGAFGGGPGGGGAVVVVDRVCALALHGCERRGKGDGTAERGLADGSSC